MKKIIDGCTAATYVAYALSDVATIYPITPIAEMGQIANQWAVSGIKNLMGQSMVVKELESELGAAGATHGALSGGALATTFTSSQGLLLMIPNMFKISGEMLPCVFHVGTRSIATHALSIFGDHQDIMACRTTGFAFLASASVQETMDLALVAHLAAIEGSVPMCHFFDGWRTSNQMATVEMIDYEDMRPLVNWDKVAQIRRKGMNPEHPQLRGSAQNPDVYFQNREAANSYYNAFPSVVQQQMDKVGKLTGRQYHLFDYYGDPQAENIIVTMGSSSEVTASTVDYLNSKGYRVGVVKVRLYRPFDANALLKAIPDSVKYISVLDRTKEPGSLGEPLFLDVAAAVLASGRDFKVLNGRYGLSSKEFDPSMVKAVFDNASSAEPKRSFTVGIDDDVTHTSLVIQDQIQLGADGMVQAKFYGIGNDGTVGATKIAASIFGDAAAKWAQAYFEYSAKKSMGYTISQLRISDGPIRAEYNIEQADYVGCNKDTYVRRFKLLEDMKPGGIFVLNSAWTLEEMDRIFPASLKRAIAQKEVRFYNVNAIEIAQKHGLGMRINTIMEAVFLKLIGIIPYQQAIEELIKRIKTVYTHEGNAMVEANIAAVEEAEGAIQQINYPQSWAQTQEAPSNNDKTVPEFVWKIAQPCDRLEGNSLPVSYFQADGFMPMGTTAYEKRAIAINVPQWVFDTCVECTECSLVCPHAAIRPYVLDEQEMANAPSDLTTKDTHMPALKGLKYRIQVYPEDCTGCGSCALICPGHALFMKPLETQRDTQKRLLQYCQEHVTIKDGLLKRGTIPGSQMYQPLLEFSGACAGCGETPYVKLLTQLFGERMVIANATGCSSIWGADYPSNPYTVNRFGHGPAWGNSLFEDNAEYGFGIAVAINHRRQKLIDTVRSASTDSSLSMETIHALNDWLAAVDDAEASKEKGRNLLEAINKEPNQKQSVTLEYITQNSDLLGKKSIWTIGGDGWAYDIGFAGLDHVLAQNENINILVMDTECYSNTGGQTSKATPLASVAKYSEDGKRTYKKDLGRMMMTYGNVYVGQVALGSNYQETINTLIEAEAYPGPSIVICYCPCLLHGIRKGLGHSILEEKEAVRTGYWTTYTYNPLLAKEGKNPLKVHNPAPQGDLIAFINGEDRYADLKQRDPQEASLLQPELEEHMDLLFAMLVQQQNMPLPKPDESKPEVAQVATKPANPSATNVQGQGNNSAPHNLNDTPKV